eukprot:TRINITY_DN2263_c0_g1_i1.p1 TRINITY_DN2263_c0_g1~~TRINITY_DN2263_c0_g1_i1.p1  ORF type:complete len:277 (+),score=58.80 TRINITY_DN2263_c0_g1_i1:812-1642(+)
MVQVTQAEKNKLAAAAASTLTTGPTRLYVGSLHVNITEDDLRLVFAPFGEIEYINLHIDPETNRSKGFAFVQYKKPEDAKKALQQINGLELAGRQLKVGFVNESKADSGVSELDDDEGLTLNPQARASLMAKLQRGEGSMSSSLPLVMPGVIPGLLPGMGPGLLPGMGPGLIPGMVPALNPALAQPALVLPPSKCVWLKNMFDRSRETDPDFHIEIRDDVEEECSKFGVIITVYVDRNSQGHVYVKFASIDSAQKAINALNHRWFAGKMISAEFFP